MPIRVAGTDPGTSSLDAVILEDRLVVDQVRFTPDQVHADPAAPVHWLEARRPFDLVAAPSGYGLPLIHGSDCTPVQRRLVALVRPDDHGRGVAGFSRMVEAFGSASFPVVFLPGVIHLDTVPVHRKYDRIDLGTADKLCVAALALDQIDRSFCLVEIGSAFTACLVVADGQIVDGLGGSAGPLGWRSPGAWDGELAYLLGPLAKSDLFRGGAEGLPSGRVMAFVESILRAVAGLLAVTECPLIVLAGRLLESHPEVVDEVERRLAILRPVIRLGSLPGAWVKHAAQGAALLADGLAGGRTRALVERLRLSGASGTVLDWIVHPRRHALAGFLPDS